MHHKPNLRVRSGTGFKGKQFEEELLYTGAMYWQYRRAYLEKNAIPTVMVGGRLVYTERRGCDMFGGIIIRTTQGFETTPLYVEAKDINDVRLPIRRAGSKGVGLKHHQLSNLKELKRYGSECWILWKRMNPETKMPEVFKISPEDADAIGPGKSIHVVHNADILQPVKRVGLCWDFLNLLSR